MRRFIAYILTSITMILCLGVAFTPVFTHIKPGREYTSGEEFVYDEENSGFVSSFIAESFVNSLICNSYNRYL